jgi:beta-glucosidase
VEGEALQIEVPGFAGGDRTAIELPEPQRKLLDALAATGKPLVLVLMSGGAVAMPWARDHADAVLAAWYPGEAGGTALGDILSGAANPSGRLPLTFYGSTRDLPSFADYNMRERTYRYYTGKPVWGFGHGLSYTSFTYGPARIAASVATVSVTNSGTREGDEVVQAYLSAPPVKDGSFNDPVLQHSLVGFQRVHLKPGETRQVRFDIDARAQSTVDRSGLRKVRAGDYRLWIGAGQPGDGPGAETGYTVTTESDIAP